MNTELDSTNDIPKTEVSWLDKFEETAQTGKEWINPHERGVGTSNVNEYSNWEVEYQEAKTRYSRKLNAEAMNKHQREYDRENILMRTVRNLKNDYGSPEELRAGAKILEELNATGKYTTIEIALAIYYNCQTVRNNSLWED